MINKQFFRVLIKLNLCVVWWFRKVGWKFVVKKCVKVNAWVLAFKGEIRSNVKTR